MEKQKFLVYFYPEENGAFSCFCPDFGQATGGRNRIEAENMAADLLNCLVDLEEYRNIVESSNRINHSETNASEVYHKFTGEHLNFKQSKKAFYKYITPKLYIGK
jgi:uncharacterised protein family (UPF0150)